MRRKYCIPLLVMLLLSSEAWAEVVVIMRRSAQTPGRYVRIGDIARVDGPKDQVREVAMTVLGPAPERGEIREISRWDVESRLFEMGVAAKVSFSGNSRVLVRGDGAPAGRVDHDQPLGELLPSPSRREAPMEAAAGIPSRPAPVAKPAPMTVARDADDRPAAAPGRLTGDAGARVGKTISHYFAERYRSGKSKRSDIEVEAQVVSASSDIPYSAYEITVADAGGHIPGKATLRLTVRDTDDAQPRDVDVVADTAVYGKTLVAARNIPRGETLDHSDVAVARVKMESGESYLPPNPKSAAGRETRRPFRIGEVIPPAEAPAGAAVKRGDLVVMKTGGKGWGIQSRVKAHGAGGPGDIITVEDVTNKAKYPARIVGPGTVEVVVKHDSHGIVRK